MRTRGDAETKLVSLCPALGRYLRLGTFFFLVLLFLTQMVARAVDPLYQIYLYLVISILIIAGYALSPRLVLGKEFTRLETLRPTSSQVSRDPTTLMMMRRRKKRRRRRRGGGGRGEGG
jgi:hypothetical protein